MKHMTRRQVAGWFLPIRSALTEILSGEVDAIRGYAVTRLHAHDDYARIDHCLAGFIGAVGRILPEADLSPLSRIAKRLAAGAPVTENDIHKALRLLKSLESPLIKADWYDIKAALTTEMIQIELNELGLAA